MAGEQDAQLALLDDSALYCEEEKWGEFEEHDALGLPLLLLEQDLFLDDEQLQSLFIKETETCLKSDGVLAIVCSHSPARKEAVEWILRVRSCHGFSALTAVLAVNYLDRFLSSLSYVKDSKPWMMQLVAVTCLSLAAKVEKTDVPLLLDLQMESSRYIFEAKTIQKMELLVLSSLKWRMNPVTPLSFVDHMIGRSGTERYARREFLGSCEDLLLSFISDWRIIRYLPSVIAAATVLHVMHKIQRFSSPIHHEHHLLGVPRSRKEEVEDCYELISSILAESQSKTCLQKRRFCQDSSSPTGVTEKYFNSDSSDDSWEASSPAHLPQPKKTKTKTKT